MNQERLKYLLECFRYGQCNDAEKDELNNWFHSWNPGTKDMEDWLGELGAEELSTELYKDFEQRVNTKPKLIRLSAVLNIAAAILIVASIVVFLYPHKSANHIAGIHKSNNNQIKPGGYKATLTLSNGSKIILTNAGNGQLALQNNIQINKISEGNISYEKAVAANNNQKKLYNTLATPRGGRITVTLSDGTAVTLDAESSLTYPVVFTGNERRVEVTGQAYFQVVHDETHPFRVSAKGQLIQDIGTSFNVNAYQDDAAVKITLAEGKVKVSNPLKVVSLEPGQQAVINDRQKTILVKSVNVGEVVAWKNGWFVFHNETINNVMKQAARWYDVEVQYEGKTIYKKFGGTISKYKDIAELMENLKLTGGINYKIEGRRVILLN
ncbi:FecR family protein [uncultured Mucilaginibacter sp.]|uniref:FecR family protein n=1 Tax=uncultured Mucilaginibacter sp. TaxID=797541 RepID=UPI002637064A|nr:FecR family protein [uncultured Mucilaginibacter sp.]